MKDTGKKFMRETYYQNISSSPQEEGAAQPPLELPVPVDAREISLPAMDAIEIPRIDLYTAMIERRSTRRYADEPLTLAELSFLLYTTQGIHEIRTSGDGTKSASFRTVPSAGARHAFETYLLINRVDTIPAGLYRYGAVKHELIELDLSPEIARKLTDGCLGQKQVLNSAVTFFWVAVAERMTWRYVERGYRYLHLDAGHICQNLSLAAEAIGAGVCAIAAYDDEGLNEALSVDGDEMFAVYVGALGKKPAA
ncbi:MAG: SagB/ThcOx family dehydrogenase [Anaerolineaceae bacterium]|nr:SagB/ThcOx family dehydrogenase [Anaerolineaceae bacterium]